MTVHSKDRKSGKTKLERIGERAKDTSCMFNNLGHVINAELLREQYHQLDGRKAIGVDGVNKTEYGKNLEENLNDLIQRIRRGTYKPKPSRLVEIPKEDGSKRPLAISCFEDKLVQTCVNKILNEIYEPMFLPCSHGFRPNESCHKALRALMKYANQNKDGAIVEIDIRKYFNTIPHKEMSELLEIRLKDRGFLALVKKLMRTPTAAGDDLIKNEAGCPQGSIISPTLANIYLHYVVDDWFKAMVRSHIRGRSDMVRYADDMVFVFQHKEEAERFYRVLPKRLKRYGLTMHEDKSQIIASGGWAANRAHRRGQKLTTYKFLGFVCYWGKARSGRWRLKYRSRSDRFNAKLKGLREYLWSTRNTRGVTQVAKHVIRVVKGWINYHAISDNENRVKAFVLRCKRTLFKWCNYRGGRKRMTWRRFNSILKYSGFPTRWKTTSMFMMKPK